MTDHTDLAIGTGLFYGMGATSLIMGIFPPEPNNPYGIGFSIFLLLFGAWGSYKLSEER